MTNPSKVSALGTYLEKTLQTLGEAEMVFEDRLPSATGKARPGKLFCGWRGTPRLQGAIEKGLA